MDRDGARHSVDHRDRIDFHQTARIGREPHHLYGGRGRLAEDDVREAAALAVRPVLEVGADDEVGALVTAFNRMTSDLKATTEQLVEDAKYALRPPGGAPGARRSAWR